MASSSSAKKKKTSSKPNSRSRQSTAAQPLSPRQKEIIGVSVMALAALLLCCIALAPAEGAEAGALGVVSLWLLRGMRFLAGNAAVMVPIFLLVFGALLLIGRHQTSGGQTAGMLILLAALLGMFSLSTPVLPFGETVAAAAQGAGGGFIGALLAFALQTAFGFAGALIVLIALAIIGLLLFTDTSLMDVFRGIRSFFRRLNTVEPRPTGQAARRNSKPRGKAETLEGEAALAYEQASRRPPLIITPDVSAPLVTDPVEPEDGTPPNPNPNRFSNQFMPDVSAAVEEMAAQEPVPGPAKRGKAKAEVKKQDAPSMLGEESEDFAPSTEGGQPALREYKLPPVELIESGIKVKNPRLNKAITDSIALLETALANFGVKATVTQVTAGPAVTRYELQPAPGVKVARIVNLADDIALALAATAVRIEAPIPGKSAIGIEVARGHIDIVYFREVMESQEFRDSSSKLAFALGKNISGEPVIGDLAKMPHLLIAGSTGSGKSICVNSIICSLLYKAKPDEVKLMLIDPKKVEMTYYNNLPHLVAPVVTDSKRAANSLKWVVNEMENRYSLFAGSAVKDFAAYNQGHPEDKLPQIVVVIDELADLMMVARHDVEDAICRIAQMARAAGIHLVVATQRPSVDVITGLIKANIPSRIAFAVSSYTDSRTILDMGGAEKLLGRGDMLYAPIGTNKPMRVQGSYIEEKDIVKLVDYCTAQAAPHFLEAAVEAVQSGGGGATPADDVDDLFYAAAEVIITSGQASTSFLQRRLAIGNPRAARLIDTLEAKGVVGGPKGAKPRDILMTMDEFREVYGDAG